MKILLLDDDLDALAVLARALRKLGHVSVLAGHPRLALELLDADIDAVITDLEMPAMDGVKAARELRARAPNLPIAFCSGADPYGVAMMTARAIGPVLTKPWRIAEVERVLETLHLARFGTAPPAR